jgi:hypothetical protein
MTLRRVQIFALLIAAVAVAQDVELRTRFRVKYVAADAIYLEGGRNAGLSEGMRLVIRPNTTDAVENTPTDGALIENVAELKVVSVATTSAVCEVVSTKRPIVTGDLVSMPQEEAEAMVQKRVLGNSRVYPAVISFSEGDPLDEEVREYVPKPPSPEVNRA